MAVDGVLFIDANLYLDLYRTATGRKLLAPLAEQQQHIFVTTQVVNEVMRNKVTVAAAWLNQQFKELKVQTFQVPDHLAGYSPEDATSLREQFSEIHKRIEEVNKALTQHAIAILEKVNRSADAASETLIPIFARAVAHDEDELIRARARKELGNPPGKKGDPIGDELNWEQLVTATNGKSGLWILSRDGDYANKIGTEVFLNPALLRDVQCRCQPVPNVYCFDNVPDGIKHFAATVGLKAEKLPTPKEVDEIKLEQESLPDDRSTRMILAEETMVGDRLRALQQQLYDAEKDLMAAQMYMSLRNLELQSHENQAEISDELQQLSLKVKIAIDKRNLLRAKLDDTRTLFKDILMRRGLPME